MGFKHSQAHRANLSACPVQELYANIDVAMGGKAAEELIFGADKVCFLCQK